ncbi:MAG: hypothetical protein HY436_00305 [Candidatus Liptonbacteria bacterium]|nr:hypothetical protein [Candidatus Liptonbacteria bacterium]
MGDVLNWTGSRADVAEAAFCVALYFGLLVFALVLLLRTRRPKNMQELQGLRIAALIFLVLFGISAWGLGNAVSRKHGREIAKIVKSASAAKLRAALQ